MLVRFVLPALTAVMLLFGACRKTEVVSYRVPKETDPPFPRGTSTEAAPANPSNPPTGPASAGGSMANTAVATADGAALTWTAPSAWKIKPPAPMRKASYAVPGDGGDAELSITAFPNDVGGETANLNRWRGQVQLAALPEKDLAAFITRFTANDLSFTVGDFANPQAPASGPQHILGAIVPFEGATWFFKLSGTDAVVAKERPLFLEFLKTVKAIRPNAP